MMISSLKPGARDLVFFPPGFGLLGFRIFWSCYLLEQAMMPVRWYDANSSTRKSEEEMFYENKNTLLDNQ
ncbi:hypothetical protein NC653_038842 [Populus alba x Populus x berolinensis]|uniref:Uncharacterized protein n=1 Tax=Populus alba x Populus x berolinensis TaxID=444605 RepID=A0AAD6LI10_9ROSI|nr:hypothetical protein NC653_038842 [Populus alba x Populus x berolinensis]